MAHPRCHVLVCTNLRQEGSRPSCGAAGRELAILLQRSIIHDERLASEVAVTSTECLGDCFSGPVAVVYPSGSWFEPADSAAILAQIAKDLDDGLT